MNSLKLIFAGIFLASGFFLNSQTIQLQEPVSSIESHQVIASDEIPEVILPNFDLEQLRYEDSINDANKIGPWRFGYSHEVTLNTDSDGIWETIPNRGKVWRLKITSQGAISLNFLMDNLHIPENGGYLTIYSENEERFFPAYTSANNLPHKRLGTELTTGETVILELFEPLSEIGTSSLTITNVIHGYRSPDIYAQNMMRALNSSGDCNIDILCPEGNGWEMQAKSVAMIVVNGDGLCTGALVNNTQNDGTPYFLTANHCGTDPTNWAFRFNWDSPNPSCATTTPSTDGPTNMQTANGGVFRAANAGSDFFLLEISNPPPASWDIYFSGWDRSDVIPDSVIGIHHPSGDVKKICKYYAQPTQTPFNAGGGNAECWEIPDWTMGVTEGGSSGSPLFDENKRIIGQLYGGSAACSNTPSTEDNGQPDYYGRFGISWDGASSSERLKDWLDPTGTDTNYIDGFYPLTITDDYDAFAVVVQNLSTSICGSNGATPSINIRNNGLQAMTSLNIKIDIAGTITTIPWTGNVASGDYETVSLGNLTFNDGDSIPVKIYTENPNGNQDQNTLNDTIVAYIDVNSTGETVNLSIQTDCNTTENAIFIENSQGVVVENIISENEYSDGFFGHTISRELCLSTDCYEIVITDTGGDGWPDDWLCFSTYNVSVDYNSNTIVNKDTFNFTTEDRIPFCLGSLNTVDQFASQINFYPNPTSSELFIGGLGDAILESEGEILDLSGRIVLTFKQTEKVSLSNLTSGTYIIRLQIGDQQPLTTKIIKD